MQVFLIDWNGKEYQRNRFFSRLKSSFGSCFLFVQIKVYCISSFLLKPIIHHKIECDQHGSAFKASEHSSNTHVFFVTEETILTNLVFKMNLTSRKEKYRSDFTLWERFFYGGVFPLTAVLVCFGLSSLAYFCMHNFATNFVDHRLFLFKGYKNDSCGRNWTGKLLACLKQREPLILSYWTSVIWFLFNFLDQPVFPVILSVSMLEKIAVTMAFTCKYCLSLH